MPNLKPLSLFLLFFALACERVFIKTHSIESRCHRTGKYTLCWRVRASFSTGILQAGAVKGLNHWLSLSSALAHQAQRRWRGLGGWGGEGSWVALLSCVSLIIYLFFIIFFPLLFVILYIAENPAIQTQKLMAFALSLALDPTFGIHSHKTLDTARPWWKWGLGVGRRGGGKGSCVAMLSVPPSCPR